MHVRQLRLRSFRSWETADIDLAPGRTVFLGRNGHGKTNLLEALWYTATLASHRVATDAPLIQVGADRAVVSTIVVNDGRELAVDLEITAGRANKARLNRAPVRTARDILGALRAVLFAPEDLALVRGDPLDRRRYLDDLATVLRPRIAAVRADYDKVLRQRTALLKSAGGRVRADLLPTLDVWDSQLAGHGAQLLAARLDLIALLRPEVVEAYRSLAPSSRSADIVYRSSVERAGAADRLDADPVEVDYLEAVLLDALSRRRSAEIERGVCLVGPHRDDMELLLGGRPAKGYASHGESWSMALALRLASFALLRADGSEPVLLLDDVFAELDSPRRDALAAVAESAEQVLITAAVQEDVPGTGHTERVAIALRDDGGQDGGRVSVVVAP